MVAVVGRFKDRENKSDLSGKMDTPEFKAVGAEGASYRLSILNISMSVTIGGQESHPTGHLQSRQNRQTPDPALDQPLGTRLQSTAPLC